MATSLFGRTKVLEGQIQDFFVNLVQAGDLFVQAFHFYLSQGASTDFLGTVTTMSLLESKNDLLRREMEQTVYGKLILPDMQSDLLKLLEGIDEILNQYEKELLDISIQKPFINKILKDDIISIVELSISGVQALVDACRSFFICTDFAEKVKTVRSLEHQIDLIALRLKKKLFNNKQISLDKKLQLKGIIEGLEQISDLAEDVSDSLTIMAIQHRI